LYNIKDNTYTNLGTMYVINCTAYMRESTVDMKNILHIRKVL